MSADITHGPSLHAQHQQNFGQLLSASLSGLEHPSGERRPTRSSRKCDVSMRSCKAMVDASAVTTRPTISLVGEQELNLVHYEETKR